jgi:hypothetical protein
MSTPSVMLLLDSPSEVLTGFALHLFKTPNIKSNFIWKTGAYISLRERPAMNGNMALAKHTKVFHSKMGLSLAPALPFVMLLIPGASSDFSLLLSLLYKYYQPFTSKHNEEVFHTLFTIFILSSNFHEKIETQMVKKHLNWESNPDSRI